MKSPAHANDGRINLSPPAEFHCRSTEKTFYDPPQGMKITFWKSFGMGVLDIGLPPGVLASLKREFAEDMHALKYVVFSASSGRVNPLSADEIEQILGIADTAKKYSLNHIEFSTACRMFLQNSAMKENLNPDGVNQTKPIQRRCKTALLPMPKIGTTLYRKDPRRKGSCKVVEIEQIRCTVVWQHSGKRSSVLLGNIRSPSLFSLEVVR